MEGGNGRGLGPGRHEDSSEEGIADSDPVEGPVDGIAAGDLLGSDVVVLAVAVVVELRTAVGLGIVLIAEATGPAEECANGRAVASDLNVSVEDVGLVEGEGLGDLSVAVGVFEGERGWRGEIAGGRGNVQSLVEAGG